APRESESQKLAGANRVGIAAIGDELRGKSLAADRDRLHCQRFDREVLDADVDASGLAHDDVEVELIKVTAERRRDDGIRLDFQLEPAAKGRDTFFRNCRAGDKNQYTNV